MIQGLNLEQIKQYNNSLKSYKDKAANLNAEIEYTNKELDRLCAELTTELGIQVTRDNVQTIYEEQVNKLNSALQSGTAVLTKIASEESNQTLQNSQQQVAVVQPAAVQPAAVNNNTVTNTVFNGQNTALPEQGVGMQLPPLFGL